MSYGGDSPSTILFDGRPVEAALKAGERLETIVFEGSNAALALSDEHPEIGQEGYNAMFHSFTPTWRNSLANTRFFDAAQLWRQVLAAVNEWEKRNRVGVHKGTPFYFLGGSLLLSWNIDIGYQYIYSAIREDRLSGAQAGVPHSYRKAPAYMFASLVDDRKNWFYDGVLLLRARIQMYLGDYITKTRSSFSLQDLDTRFLQNDAFEVPKLFFTYVIYELLKQDMLWKDPNSDNDFLRMKNRDRIFDLCLVVDKTLSIRFPTAGDISQGVFEFGRHGGFLNISDHNPGDLNGALNPRVAGRRPAPDPNVVVPALLGGTITYHGNPVAEQFRWLLLAWHLRNFGAHELSPVPILSDQFAEIVGALMNGLFSVTLA